eukprot:TRINITY_DN23831_c0_g1_i2.p1 TRINITY_DN23831_c0_g1~~TRINITY_DN23831_c0_g1_i2.p1  ORF type:complete len:138 (+),score=21.93 TRINITY_DN23831_c0_g1_i2:196-609(+)
MNELREFKRQAEATRRSEAQLAVDMQRAEISAQRARQELNVYLSDVNTHARERSHQARTNEAEVFAEAWKMSGELRSELNEMHSKPSRQKAPGVDESAAAGSNAAGGISSARQALEDLRKVRQRYSAILKDSPADTS